MDQITGKEYNQLSAMIEEASGICLGPDKKDLVLSRLKKRLRALGLSSYKEYIKYLTSHDEDGEEFAQMLTAISTNITSFFRENDHFIFLKDRVLPEIAQKRAKDPIKKIRCWSAGCSSGEEPYSIAITISEFIGDEERWDAKVLATDVSTRVLDLANRGVYKMAAIEGVPYEIKKEYFYKGHGDMEGFALVKEELKEMVHVRYLNLMDEVYPFHGPFDFIFCRNVMIYFDRETQKKLLEKYYRFLGMNGYLFVGHSEGLTGTNPGFKYVAPAVYMKVPQP